MFRRASDSICRAVAWRLPKRLVYWCSIRLMASASTGHYRKTVVPKLTAVEALQRWERHIA